MPLFLQPRHDFTVRAAQLLKTGREVILKSSKTTQKQAKRRKKNKNSRVKMKRKIERALCVCVCVVCVGVCLLPDACRGPCEVS